MKEKEDYTIDAKGQKLGRVASEAAKVLMGKDTSDFQKHILAGRTVRVINASGLDITEKKLDQKEYISFSGYPGGQKRITLRKLLEKKGYGEVLRRAVYGMLPVNRLRTPLLKRLIVTD